MKDPKIIVLAKRELAAIACLILAQEDGSITLTAFSFTDEPVKTAMSKALELMGLPKDAHISVQVIVWEIPASVPDGQVVSRFAAAVNAKDTAYFYGLVNSNGGSA